MSALTSAVQAQAVREIFISSVMALSKQMNLVPGDRPEFVRQMTEHFEKAVHELAADRPRWFDEDERALLEDVLESVADDEHPVEGSLVRDDDLLRTVLRELSRAEESALDALSDDEERVAFERLVRRPGVKEFLLAIPPYGVQTWNVEDILEGIDWRTPLPPVVEDVAEAEAAPAC